MLPQRSEVGQGQPADPPGPVPPADPDEGPGGVPGEEGEGCGVRALWLQGSGRQDGGRE